MNLRTKAWRILLVDDHPVLRDGLRALLRRILPSSHFESASSCAEAVQQLAAFRPHLALVDVHLPDANGLEFIRRVRAADARIRLVMVAGDTDPWTVREAMTTGAAGFIGKVRAVECLDDALQEILGGGEYLCPDSRSALIRSERAATADERMPGPAALSGRELEVLRHLARGENTKSTAALLGISPKTVETHRMNILTKLHASGLAALVRYAIRHGLVEA